MDMVFSQFPDRLSALEQENAILRSRLRLCEQSHALLQAELAIYRRDHADPQDQDNLHSLKRCLLETTAAVANTLLSIPDFNIAIKTALQILGEALETDRLIVAENFASQSGAAFPSWRLLYEWDSPGTTSQIDCPDLVQGSWQGIEEWYERLSQGQSIVCFIEDIPEPFRRMLAELGAKAIHSVPIFVEGQYWGQLGFDDCREAKRRSVVELSVLRIAADCIGSAIQQQRTQQSLLQIEQQRSQELEGLNAELQQALDRLAESEKRYRTLFELSNEGIYHFEFDAPIPISLPLSERLELAYRTNRLTEVNLAFAQQYGLDSPADIVGSRISDFYVEGSQRNRQTNEELLTNFQVCNLETEEVDQFGNRRYFLSSVVCTVQGDEILNGWGIQKDITELREAQQALLQAEQERVTELERINAELQQTLDRLLKSEERFCTLFELSSEGFYYIEVDPPCPISLPIEEQCDLLYRNIRVVKANPAFAAMYGVAHPDELIGLRNADVHVPGSEKNAAFIRGTIENGYRFRNLETEEIDTQGRQRYFLNSGVYTIKDGYAVSAWNTQVDITELRQTQQALLQAEQARSAELAKANKALKQTVDILAAEADLDRFLGHVLEVIARQLDAPLTEYWYHPEPDNIAYVGLTYWQGQILKPEEQPGHVGLFGYPVPPEMVQQESLHHRRGHFIIDDLTTSAVHIRIAHEYGLDASAWYKLRGVSRLLNMPLILGEKTIGALLVFLPSDRPFTEPQIELTYALAQQVTLAIQLTQLAEAAKQTAIAREQEKAAQQQAAELSRANILLRNSLSRLSTQPNLNDVLGHLLVELVRYADAAVGHIFIHDAVQDTLNLTVRCQDGQAFWTPADDEPALFRSPIPVEHTSIFTDLCAQPRLAILNQDDFEDRLWPGISPWFQAKGYRGTCSCVLMVGDRPFGLLAMAFVHPVAFQCVEEELILALTQQIALVVQLTSLGEADKQAAIAREQEKAALERATELAKANNALNHSLDRLAQESDLDSFLGHVLGEIAHQVEATVGHIFLLNAETNTLQLCLAIHKGQLYRQAQPDKPILFQSAIPADITPVFQYLCQKRTLSWVSAGEFEGMAWAGTPEWFEQEGFTEAVCLALIVGERPVGMLGLAFHNKSTLKPEEAELIHALAHQATLAIQLTRLAEEAKQVAIFEERNRMAGEIHDTLAQVFTGISLQLEVAKPLVYQDPQTVAQILEHLSQLAETGLAEARRSVWALYPPAAEYADLAQMLYDSVEQMTRNTAVVVEVSVQGEPCPLPPLTGMNMLRIGQEALTNALKHAQAQTITIELAYELDRILLAIRDNGRGFAPPTTIDTLNGGFGLMGMYERCDRIGAQLSLISQLGQGTQVLVEAPLN